MNTNLKGKWLEKYKMSLWGLAGLALLFSFATLVVMLLNVKNLEKNRYQEYNTLAQGIAETTESFIVNRQHGDFYKIAKLMTQISFIKYLAFFIDDEMIFQSGDGSGLSLDWRKSPAGGKHVLHIDYSHYLYWVDQAYSYLNGKQANVVVAFSFREFIKSRRGILAAFWLNIFVLAMFGLLGYIIYRAEWTKSHMLRTISHNAMHNFQGLNGSLFHLIDQKQGRLNRDQMLVELKTIRENTLSIKRILENLCDHERLGRGKVKVNWQEVDMSSLIQFAQTSYEPTLREKQITLLAELPNQSMLIWTDRELVKSVLLNLVDNAIKYSPPNTHIHIRLLTENRMVKVLIQDQGLGIARQNWKRVFKPFLRLPPIEKVEGSGLGLSNARLLIRLLGGDLGIAASELGKGTIFYFNLPITENAGTEVKT